MKVIHKDSKRVETLGNSLPLFFLLLNSSFASALAICNHACLCDVSYDCSLTCNCVKKAALSICNAGLHQCLMQSLSLFHFPPCLPLSLSVCGSSPPFGIDLSLAANEKELHFLGLESAALFGSWLVTSEF